MSVNVLKTALRRQVQARLKEMTPAERVAASARARSLLVSQRRWQEARTILFFAPLPEEIDLWPLLAESLSAGKEAALPRFDAQSKKYIPCQVRRLADDIKTGRFGIREPADGCAECSSKRLDLLLVPGVAFDLHGRRLGRGKGFYDQLLATVGGPTCGVAFDEQVVGEVPVEPHDARVNCILTPTRWLEL